jgi:hypothetical protein
MYIKKFYKLSNTKINLNDELSDTSTVYEEENKNFAYKDFYETCAAACIDLENQYWAIQLIEYSRNSSRILENKIFDKRQFQSDNNIDEDIDIDIDLD